MRQVLKLCGTVREVSAWCSFREREALEASVAPQVPKALERPGCSRGRSRRPCGRYFGWGWQFTWPLGQGSRPLPRNFQKDLQKMEQIMVSYSIWIIQKILIDVCIAFIFKNLHLIDVFAIMHDYFNLQNLYFCGGFKKVDFHDNFHCDFHDDHKI